MVKNISMCESRDFLFNHVIYTNPIRNFFEFHTHDICELIFLKKGNVSGISETRYIL
jgi:hypothetical protein